MPVPALSSYIDVHTHIDSRDPNASVEMAVRSMGSQNAAKLFLLAEPYPQNDPARYDAEIFLPSAKKYPDKLAVLGGGGTLNAMILESARSGDSGPEVKRQFKERAEELLREGVAGFGELTAEHLSQPSSGIKDYEYAPPDHPLFLLLADIAAEHHVPIDLHMEAVPQTMPLPADLTAPNPPQLIANIAQFERLLAHNRGAKIIWAHAGADFTGISHAGALPPAAIGASQSLYGNQGRSRDSRPQSGGSGRQDKAGLAQAVSRLSRPFRDRQRSALRAEATTEPIAMAGHRAASQSASSGFEAEDWHGKRASHL